ncbi:MAG: FAD-dependent oxidoreductase [Actinomycetota bacterium]|nr:FAD-dependent oxidoreductase [Actinomycetota bacterium]
MAKPAILAVDDDREVLQAVARDLRTQYGRDYRVLTATSGRDALELLEELTLRNDAVALLLVDQRMPEMTGVEFLEEAIGLFPDVKRALLTAYADTEAAIRAINNARLDYYIMKPWDPPEERLYPILDELLDDWRADYRPPFEGIRVVANRWSREAHELKRFLARNQVPYESLDLDTDDEARRLFAIAEGDVGRLPLVLLEDGSPLMQPTPAELAERVGIRTRAELPFYDFVVVGGGPAGLAASVYAASEGLKVLLVESEAPGGQAGTSSKIDNYLGFPSGLSGAELARRAVTQAKRFGVELLVPLQAAAMERNDPYRNLTLSDGSKVGCHALLVATGVQYRKLQAPGVEELTGAGVYYGASRVEAGVHQGEDVFVVGGGNSAGQAAMFLAAFARSVTMLVRGPDLSESMSQYLIDILEATDNFVLRPYSEVVGVSGDGRLEKVSVADRRTGEVETLPAGALFVFIGQAPRTEWLGGLVRCDERGFVLSGTDCGPSPKDWTLERPPFPMETSVPGIFVAGDVRHGATPRIASATGEGALAVRFVHQHLASL